MPKKDTDKDNETIKTVKTAKAVKKGAEKAGIGWKTAAGIGVGSAAVVAALLYANKARKKDD